MRAQEFELPVQYIRQIADQVIRLGAGLPASFRQHNWHDIATHGNAQTLRFDVFERLVQDAIFATGEPALGLLVGERMAVNSHGILGYAAMNSATVGEAIELLERYFQLRTRLVRLRHETAGDELRFVFEESIPLGAIRRPVLEAIVLTIKNLFDFIAAGALRVKQVSFPFAQPAYTDLATRLFKSEVRFGQSWAGFILPLDGVSLPLAMGDPTTLRQTVQICQGELEKISQHQTWNARLRRVLLEQQGGFPSLEVAAGMFHLTPRTLHRRLADEGTSYGEVLDEVRHMLAVEQLKAGNLSIQEIAYALGYTDVANFRRAFKRWESMSPTGYRVAAQAPA